MTHTEVYQRATEREFHPAAISRFAISSLVVISSLSDISYLDRWE